MTSDIVRVGQVYALHAPVWDETYHGLYCNGCDFGGWEGERPSWPCRTASLVYSEQVIADWQEAAELFDRWWVQMSNRNPAPARNWFLNVGEVWAGAAEKFIAEAVFPKVKFNTNPISFRKEPWPK